MVSSEPSIVGIDLFGLIRLKQSPVNSLNHHVMWSGLICLDWYDWNTIFAPFPLVWLFRRDWSVWIDTIETQVLKQLIFPPVNVGIDLSELIRLKLRNYFLPNNHLMLVGIVLSELIRLKQVKVFCCYFWYLFKGRDWSVWIDTIETFPDLCLNMLWCIVGIDLFGLIRLKLRHTHDKDSAFLTESGLICLDWYDWNQNFWPKSGKFLSRRDWSVWIDTIETPLVERFAPFLQESGLICLDWYDWKLSKEPQSKSHNRVVGIISLFDSF